MKALLSLIISGALVVSGFGQTRNVLVGTNNAVVQPTNFWSADASNARTGLGLGTAATNPASAFQASSANLTNLASNNGGILTNLQATNIVGVIPSSNIPSVTFTNLSGTLSIAQGGTGATNAANARQNLGSTTVGDAVFIATNAAAARTAIGALSTSGDAINLTNFPTLLLRTNGNGSGLTNLTAANITGTVALASNVTGTIAISNGGSGATTAGGARTNLELGATNNVLFNSLHAEQDASSGVYTLSLGQTNTGFRGTGGGASDFVFARNGTNILGLASGNIQSFVGHSFNAPLTLNYGAGSTAVIAFAGIDSATGAAISRTNLGLGWSALTNTTASGFQTALFGTGTNPVLVNTNGEVVSPTNFWQEAPITTTFIESQPTTNSSTNISPSRLLHIHSLSTNVVNTTNTIILPTNVLTFEGDMALVVHKGPTNSLTQVRQAGSTNNLITLNKFNEAVEFTYYNDTWQFLETASFTAPIYFSGTNATANAAASRTNLGLGATNDVAFSKVLVNTIQASSTTLMLQSGSTNAVLELDDNNIIFTGDTFELRTPVSFGGTNPILFAAITRTNLGLGATNDVTFNDIYAASLHGIGDTNAAIDLENRYLAFTSAVNGAALDWGGESLQAGLPISFATNTHAATTRTNLGIGATNIVTFAGLTNNGDITINQTATNNGLLYINRTNNEPFLGLANLIASNNVTVSNESLFRVGVAEATNKAAQFGFRSTNTNGNGVAVFSVFGYNALMMVGPSDPNAGTNPIEATIYSVSPTNKVATLITTNTGAMQMHRSLGFDTNLSSVGDTNLVPATNNQISKWLRVYIGTNTFYLPLYQ